jgi:tetratricopeptide (TPR) repeat protein
MPNETLAPDHPMESLLAVVRAGDADGISVALDRLGETMGTAAPSAITTALDANGLTDAMLAAVTERARKLDTAAAWSQLAAAAATTRRAALAIEAAQTALQRDAATPLATLILSSEANQRGDHATALRLIADLVAKVPAAKNEPMLNFQKAVAELGRNQPHAAVGMIDAALPGLTAAGMGFDAHVIRARALGTMSERTTVAAQAWERALAAARHPMQTDLARDGLIAALYRAKRYDDSLRQIEEGLATTTDASVRAGWLEARANLLMTKGDIDGAVAAFDDVLATISDPAARLPLQLKQARAAAMGGRWKKAAACFDAALAEIPGNAADAHQQRHAIQLEKVQRIALGDIDCVLSDLDELDASWTGPDWPAAIDARMNGLLSAGRAREALLWLDQNIARFSGFADHPAVHHWRGEALLRLQRTEEAMQSYAHAVENTSAATDVRSCGAILTSATATQQWKAAAAAYNRLLTLNPAAAADPDIRVIAGMGHLRLGQHELALKLTEDPPPASPRMQDMRDQTRGEAQLHLRQFDAALATTGAALERCHHAAADTVPAEFLLTLHLLRTQVFNMRGDFKAALAAATAAIDVPDGPVMILEGLTSFLRIGAYLHRSLAHYRLGEMTEAHADIDAALARYGRLRSSAIFGVMERSQDFDSFETSLWFAKGAVLHAESRSEEALAAYSRAERLEKHGNVAAVARGYALALTGAFEPALAVFDAAIARASSAEQRADALAGKGRALVRLKRFEDALLALQQALDERLTEPDNDPDVFELLGIAYDALKRNGAALRAFRRAWTLTAGDKRGANLARGIVAAELRLGNPTAALEFLDALPERLRNERTLIFNRALALDTLGQRPAAIACLVAARTAGLDRAQRELDRLDAPAGMGRWTHHWFGAQAMPRRRAGGVVLLAIAATGFAAPLFQWWLKKELDWYLLLLPSVVALALLVLPNMKSISVEAGSVKLEAEPLPATGREAAAPGAPESFVVPPLGPVTIATSGPRSAGA